MADPQRPEPYPVPSSASPVNRAGRVALIAGIAAAVEGLVQQGVSVYIPVIMNESGAGVSQIAGIFSALIVAHTLIAAVALAFGAYGVTRPGLPHAAAGVGLGIGAVGVAAGIVALVIVPLVSLTL
jgi:hypothetical protein